MPSRQCSEDGGVQAQTHDAERGDYQLGGYGNEYNLAVGFVSALLSVPATRLLDILFQHAQSVVNKHVRYTEQNTSLQLAVLAATQSCMHSLGAW